MSRAFTKAMRALAAGNQSALADLGAWVVDRFCRK